jgi:hypothetical protein
MIGTSSKTSIGLAKREDVPMTIKFGLPKELVNTQIGPVAALAAYYESQKVLEPLQIIIPAVEKSEFPLANQLTQVILSILTGCEYLSMVNTRLRPELKLSGLLAK